MRNALAHAGKSGCRVISAFIATAFAQDTHAAAKAQWRSVADQLRPAITELAALIDCTEDDVLAYMTFPTQHSTKLQTQPDQAPQWQDQNAAPTSSASSQMNMQSVRSLMRSCSNSMMNGPSSAAGT
jgi:transposase-like protein